MVGGKKFLVKNDFFPPSGFPPLHNPTFVLKIRNQILHDIQISIELLLNPKKQL